MTIRALFHTAPREHFAVRSDEKLQAKHALEVLQSGLFR